MNKLKSIIKENYISILIIVIAASIVYLLLSLVFGGWTLFGQILTPILGIVIYVILKLFERDKDE